MNVIWNIPVICNQYYNFRFQDSTYLSLRLETLANLGFNFGGILELAIDLTQDQPEMEAAVATIQGILMGLYGGGGAGASALYKYMPNQHH